MNIRYLLLAVGLALGTTAAMAQQTTNPPVIYPTPTASGLFAAPGAAIGYLDVSGKFVPASAANPIPFTGTITPPANQSVNITQILGAAPSLTNPLWMYPATGATFPVSGTFWQATQPVSLATAPTTPVTGTFWQTTQPVSGNLSGFDFQLAPTITVQNASYSAGNSLGGTITVTGAARTNGGSGLLDGLRLRSAGGATNTIWVYAWSKTPAATCTDKSAYVTSASDAPYALIGFPTSVTLGPAPGVWDATTVAQLTNIVSNFKNQDTTPGTAIYLCLITAGTVTPATTTDLSIVLGGIQD